MAEIVVEMEMPKESCLSCDARCVSDLYGYICGIKRKNVMPFLGKKNRPDWCPILCSLPEGHGRLVDMKDIDLMMEDASSTSDESGLYSLVYRDDLDFDGLPTIVPADAESQAPNPTDPLPIRGFEYVPTEVDVKAGTVTYELRERSET